MRGTVTLKHSLPVRAGDTGVDVEVSSGHLEGPESLPNFESRASIFCTRLQVLNKTHPMPVEARRRARALHGAGRSANGCLSMDPGPVLPAADGFHSASSKALVAEEASGPANS